MEDQLDLSEVEIIGIAAAAALALGGLVVGLSRGQERSAAPNFAKVAESNLDDAVESVRKRTPDVKSTVDKSVNTISDRAPEALGRIQETVKQRLPEVQDSATSRLTELRERAMGAAENANGKRIDTSKMADYLLPLAVAARDRISQAVHEGRKQTDRVDPSDVSHRLEDARDRAVQALHDQRDQLGSISQSVSEETSAKKQMVAERSKSIAKETTMSVIWLSLASALVYFVLLSPERREQVKSAICGAYDQGRLLFLDLQGYDPEY